MHHRLILLTVVALVPACGRSKESRCKRFADDGMEMMQGLANGVADGLARGLGDDKTVDVPDIELPKADLEMAKRKLVEECLTWPDEFVYCMTDGDFESARCQAAVAAKEGTIVSGEGDVGPEPRKRAMAKYDQLVCLDRRCLVDGDDRITATDGAEVVAGEIVGTIDEGTRDLVLAQKDGEVSLISAAGEVVRKVTAPREGPDDPHLTALAAAGDRLVLFSDGRVRRLALGGCEQCFEDTPWQLASQPSEWDHPSIYPLPDGGLAYHGSQSHLIVFAADGTRRLHLRARDELSAPLFDGGVLYVGMGKEAFMLDLAECRSEGPIEAAELTAPCVKARVPLAGVAWIAPQKLGEAVYFNGDGRVQQLIDGKAGWAADVDCTDLVALPHDGRRYVLVARHWTMDHAGGLLVLDPDSGKTLLRSDILGDYEFADFAVGADDEHVFVTARYDIYTWDLRAIVDALED